MSCTTGAQADAKDNGGQTALMYASGYGYADVVGVLLKGGKKTKEAHSDMSSDFFF